MHQNDQQQTPAYEKPKVADYGDLSEITAAVGRFGSFDQTFQQGQPIPDEYGTQTQP